MNVSTRISLDNWLTPASLRTYRHVPIVRDVLCRPGLPSPLLFFLRLLLGLPDYSNTAWWQGWLSVLARNATRLCIPISLSSILWSHNRHLKYRPAAVPPPLVYECIAITSQSWSTVLRTPYSLLSLFNVPKTWTPEIQEVRRWSSGNRPTPLTEPADLQQQVILLWSDAGKD